MAQVSASQRAQIAERGAAVIEGKVRFIDFVHTLTEVELHDELVDELVDILEHEPKVGGFLGVSKEMHEKYMARAHEIIGLLGG